MCVVCVLFDLPPQCQRLDEISWELQWIGRANSVGVTTFCQLSLNLDLVVTYTANLVPHAGDQSSARGGVVVSVLSAFTLLYFHGLVITLTHLSSNNLKKTRYCEAGITGRQPLGSLCDRVSLGWW